MEYSKKYQNSIRNVKIFQEIAKYYKDFLLQIRVVRVILNTWLRDASLVGEVIEWASGFRDLHDKSQFSSMVSYFLKEFFRGSLCTDEDFLGSYFCVL